MSIPTGRLVRSFVHNVLYCTACLTFERWRFVFRLCWSFKKRIQNVSKTRREAALVEVLRQCGYVGAAPFESQAIPNLGVGAIRRLIMSNGHSDGRRQCQRKSNARHPGGAHDRNKPGHTCGTVHRFCGNPKRGRGPRSIWFLHHDGRRSRELDFSANCHRGCRRRFSSSRCVRNPDGTLRAMDIYISRVLVTEAMQGNPNPVGVGAQPEALTASQSTQTAVTKPLRPWAPLPSAQTMQHTLDSANDGFGPFSALLIRLESAASKTASLGVAPADQYLNEPFSTSYADITSDILFGFLADQRATNQDAWFSQPLRQGEFLRPSLFAVLDGFNSDLS